MGFIQDVINSFKSIFGAQRPPGTGDDRYLTVFLYSNRCREALHARIDRMNELSIAEPSDDVDADPESVTPPNAAWYVRKVVHTSGERRCFGEVEVELWLDNRKQVIQHVVKGGRWLEEDEYNALIDEEIERLAAEDAAESLTDEVAEP